MKKRYIVVVSMALMLIALICRCYDNPYFRITAEDVILKVPKGFPKPIYVFKGNTPTPEGFILGRKLFYDPILSRDSSTSCASCHQRLAAFGHFDHPLSHGIKGLIGTRNVPGLFNLMWKDSYMWDGGVNHLEVQPLSPLTNAREMDESLAHVLMKLRRSAMYRQDFSNAFHDTIISSERLLKALAQFTGLMVSANARYDKYMRQEDTFSTSEKTGYVLFKQKCESCHREPLFTDNSYRNNGIRPDTALNDRGRAIITGSDEDLYKFKVPSLRNVELTYPYMHDGRMHKLRQVLDHYGDPKNFAAGADKALLVIGKLTDEQKNDLVAFLLTLTDKQFVYDRRFIDPFMK